MSKDMPNRKQNGPRQKQSDLEGYGCQQCSPIGDVKLKKNDYIDLLAQCPKFVIFTKANRLQIIHEPTKNQIRKRGKARWKIALVTNNLHEADKGLMEAFGKLP